MYSAPEMVLDLDYDEKIDFWSLGVTLFELYFEKLPYSPTANNNVMLNYFNGVYPWSFKKTKDPKDTDKNKYEKRKKEDIIPSLDILFRRLLTLNPKDRMTLNELYNYVNNVHFMEPGYIYPNYNKMYEQIEKEPALIYDDEIIL
jgi:serine/threonine protein kinase